MTKQQEQYEAALKTLKAAQDAFDGSPAAIAWVREASDKLAEIQREIRAAKAGDEEAA